MAKKTVKSLPKLKVKEHVVDVEMRRQSATTSQHSTQRKITEKQEMSSEKIRRRIQGIDRQMTHLATDIKEHKKRAAEHNEIMDEHARLFEENKEKRQSLLQLDIQTEEYQIPQVDDHPKLRKERQEIQCKVEEHEKISRKIQYDSQTINHLIKEIESSHKEINDSKLNKQERKLNIESRCEEIHRMKKELNDFTSTNDMVELQDNIEVLHEDIEKWAERFQCLKKTVYSRNWQNNLFEDTARKLEDNMSLRDQKASDIEEHICSLKVLIRVEEMMSDHKDKVARCRSFNFLRKQQEGSMRDRMKKMDEHQKSFLQRYNCTKEEYQKALGGRPPNTSFENENINGYIKDIEYKFMSIEESGGRIQEDITEINKINNAAHRSITWNSEIEQKYKEEIRFPENKYLSKEHMRELNDLCLKLDRWNEEYRIFEEDHDQWIKKKSELEETMEETEQNVGIRVEQTHNIDESIICLNKMIDAEEKIKELRKMMDELIDVEKQNEDLNRRRAEVVENIKEHEKNRLNGIQGDLSQLQNCLPRSQYISSYWSESQERSYENRQQFGRLMGNVISKYLSEVKTSIRNNIWGREATVHEFKLVGPSNEREKLEGCVSHIMEIYEEVKQKNEKLTGHDCMKDYLDKIENLCLEIDSCNQDVRKTISVWETEIDTFEKKSKTVEDAKSKEIHINNGKTSFVHRIYV